MLTFNIRYFTLATAIFITEVLIALYVRDQFVRPYMGDVLVVILLYCLVRAFLILPARPLALSVLVLSFAVEGLQYLQWVEWLGLSEYTLARTLMGTTFQWMDLVAYSVGFLMICGVESFRQKRVAV